MQGARTEDFHGAVRRHLKDSGVPVENSKGEWGRGQHEVNVRYADTLTMADRHVVFKQCMKELADAMGVAVTFMAKIGSNQAGSGCHIHFSLRRDGRNAFVGDKPFGPLECSDEFRWFLGGWIARVPDVMVFYAPTVNSYKRYVDASWAPTRLACRVATTGLPAFESSARAKGCASSAAFPAPTVIRIWRSRRPWRPAWMASRITPSRRTTSAATSTQHRICPACRARLAKQRSASAVATSRSAAFRDDVVEHYLHFYQSEQRAYDMAVTDWEIQRYFERI